MCYIQNDSLVFLGDKMVPFRSANSTISLSRVLKNSKINKFLKIILSLNWFRYFEAINGYF